MNADQKLALSRRAFASGMAGALAAWGSGDATAATGRPETFEARIFDDADLRDAAFRGLARAGDHGDPVLAAKADTVIAALESTDPEGAALVRIYRQYDVASAFYQYGDMGGDQASVENLAILHLAVRDCRAASFHYIDLAGEVTVRTVLPLALVHPPQGIKLLAWCEKRGDYRQFFVRALSALTLQGKRFVDRRLPLLRALADSAIAPV